MIARAGEQGGEGDPTLSVGDRWLRVIERIDPAQKVGIGTKSVRL